MYRRQDVEHAYVADIELSCSLISLPHSRCPRRLCQSSPTSLISLLHTSCSRHLCRSVFTSLISLPQSRCPRRLCQSRSTSLISLLHTSCSRHLCRSIFTSLISLPHSHCPRHRQSIPTSLISLPHSTTSAISVSLSLPLSIPSTPPRFSFSLPFSFQQNRCERSQIPQDCLTADIVEWAVSEQVFTCRST